MGNCIICGQSVDGHICDSHEQDVVFEFAGDHPEQLTPDRYYRGRVDGYAEFGVFVDVGGSVTGLLHKSELDRRLDSLDWEPGDVVFVQVTDVRDNGNVDLGWSIRQDEAEFRGTLIDDPEGDRLADDESSSEATTSASEHDASDDDAGSAPVERDGEGGVDGDGGTGGDGDAGSSAGGDAGSDQEPAIESDEGAAAAAETAGDGSSGAAGPDDDEGRQPVTGGGAAVAVEEQSDTDERVTAESLAERVGDRVRLEGEIVGVRQTSGPTVFELRDETGTVECAAFKSAGVRAYPEIETGDLVRLEGEVERHEDQLQVETEALIALEGEDRETVAERLDDALTERARPPADAAPLVERAPIDALGSELDAAATVIRKAVLESRPVVIRHSATADGYVAGAAIERAALGLIREEHAREDAQYHFLERRPLPDVGYDMEAATDDVTDMLEDQQRHGEQFPLVVLVDAGSTLDSREGYGLLDVYGAERLVIDDGRPDGEVREDVETMVNPHLVDADEPTTATTLAADVAARINPDVRTDVKHLPAVSYWEEAPDAYAQLADEAGIDGDDARELREAVALEAHYQTYKDKRELITDILFDGEARDGDGEARSLVSHVSQQFREKLDDEVETALHNLSTDTARGVDVSVIDTDAFTHRFDFPPADLLLEELHRRRGSDDDAPRVTIGLGEDELRLCGSSPIDVRSVAETVRERAPDAGVSVAGGRDGHLQFLAGERDEVLEAAVAAVTEELA